jgi:hypothetical protein
MSEPTEGTEGHVERTFTYLGRTITVSMPEGLTVKEWIRAADEFSDLEVEEEEESRSCL